MQKPSAKQIDALLPQTQCGLCSYKGCMPYAEALAAEQADINLCPPGGVPGLLSLATLLGKDATPFIADMTEKTKPHSVAVIREAECIGCTKCIQACPVDAILGSAKQMHSVIRAECTGCELCIAPCPVDCIDIQVTTTQENNSEHYRKRYYAREQRLQKKVGTPQTLTANNKQLEDKKSYIEAAILRANKKRSM